MERVVVSESPIGRAPHARRVYRFVSAARSHPGAVRDHNEDYVFAGQNLVAVADGVGGSVYGEVASEVVIAAIAYLEDRIYIGDPDREVAAAVRYANERLVRAIDEDRARMGMATTLTGLRLDGTSIIALHIGDSRAYSLHDGQWRRLTRDDSLVQQLVDAGAISEDEAKRHPARSVVLQALNGGPVEPHVTTHDVVAGDRLLVCSDGLTDYVDESTVAGIVAGVPDPAAACAALIEAALAVGAPDNVSCVIADVQDLATPLQ
jgi:PPM family protein phosphatase